MYYEYWGLKKPPFDNVPDPSMYVDCHTSMENAISETLFAIEEANECIAVIIGDVGLGKTMSLRMIIDSLDQEKYKIALITNPGITFVQLLREIIGQLTGKQCEEKKKVDLLEVFNKLLFETLDEGKKVVIFIDEANAIAPADLESLRLLTNMQDDERNLFTMVLAGQTELARRLEHPKRANLFQRIGTYGRIDKIQSEDLLRTYVETRLRLAGAARNFFVDDTFSFLWKHSEQGVPRLINKICKLCLKAGETNKFEMVTGEVVNQIGERFKKLTRSTVQKRRPRKRSGATVIPEPVDNLAADLILQQVDNSAEELILQPDHSSDAGMIQNPVKSTENILGEIVEHKKIDNVIPIEENTYAPILTAERIEESIPVAQQESDEIEIGGLKITLDLPGHLVEQARSSTQEHRMKLAGVVAAQTLKKNPELSFSHAADPVSIWSEIRDVVITRLEG